MAGGSSKSQGHTEFYIALGGPSYSVGFAKTRRRFFFNKIFCFAPVIPNLEGHPTPPKHCLTQGVIFKYSHEIYRFCILIGYFILVRNEQRLQVLQFSPWPQKPESQKTKNKKSTKKNRSRPPSPPPPPMSPPRPGMTVSIFAKKFQHLYSPTELFPMSRSRQSCPPPPRPYLIIIRVPVLVFLFRGRVDVVPATFER